MPFRFWVNAQDLTAVLGGMLGSPGVTLRVQPNVVRIAILFDLTALAIAAEVCARESERVRLAAEGSGGPKA